MSSEVINRLLPSSNPRHLPGQLVHEQLREPSRKTSRDPSHSVTQKFMDEVDQGCMITGVHRHTDEIVRIINVQSADEDIMTEVVSVSNIISFCI